MYSDKITELWGDREHRFHDYMKIYVQLPAFGCERGTTQVGFNKFDYERGEGHGRRGKWKIPQCQMGIKVDMDLEGVGK